MRAVTYEGDGVLSLNYMWLPTFIGLNAILKTQMERDLHDQLKGLSSSDADLDRAHDAVVAYLVQRFSDVRGLDLYLDALKYIEP